MTALEASFTHIVHSVEMSKYSHLVIKGIIKSGVSYEDTIQLMVKKRKSKTFFTFSLKWLGSNCWETTVDFHKTDIEKGTWDYYLLYNNEQKYRLKIEDECIFEWNRISVFNSKDVTYGYKCYITQRDSLSTVVFRPSMELIVQQREILNERIVYLSGTITGNDFVDSASGFELLIKERDSDNQYEAPLYFELEGNQICADLKINYDDILPENITNLRWDVYVRVKRNGTSYLFRIHLTDETLEKDTCVELQDDQVYQIRLYPTIKGNLSIKCTELKMKRDIVSYSIENQHVNFKGFAYFDLVKFDSPDKLERFIKVKKRNSEKEMSFPICNLEPEEASIEDDYRFSGFNVSIPLKKLTAMMENELDIYDFSICLVYRNQEKERNLGCEEYSYFVDSPLVSDLLRYRLKMVRTFLLFTPGGNLKLEAYTYSFCKMMYMKYRQARVKKSSGKDVWLIGERPDTAQDTGYHFFKFCREHYPKKDIYYVITADSPDRKNLRGLGNVITFGSLKHFKLAATAYTFIGSHDLEYILPTKAIDWPNYQEGQRVFLQHGILGRKKVNYHKKYYKYPFTVFCVSSKPEFNLVTEEMGYNSEEVKITGLSRFDQLMGKHETERSILLIPTWRDWVKEDTFIDSEYFNRYKELLNDSRLNHLLEKHDIRLDFYVHYRMQPSVHHFYEWASANTNIVEFGQSDVQELLIRNKLLITDYSSVSFDFNYMRKPVLFYHFDFDQFFKNGLLRPANKTFLGETYTDKNSLIDAIEMNIENDFKEKSAIKKKKETIFSNIDENNRERIFDAITNVNRP
ncbi:hypothetical protein GCM10007063_24950 [Lentibacillus kapialis]|uniref:Teichoic acid biosynthesis protein n=1 Tax=Lentibacillus kapialis TaxID=340214 RepID=A0A917UZY0_9BACI|nr:CDP-glycerol glycerophosphotransferase family protein [Lentibacillus kapialis]GGK01644.1 hypothetical protein GCM10007063_24950 [Lentibacillus kapialis]